jgi:hypothetical protein
LESQLVKDLTPVGIKDQPVGQSYTSIIDKVIGELMKVIAEVPESDLGSYSVEIKFLPSPSVTHTSMNVSGIAQEEVGLPSSPDKDSIVQSKLLSLSSSLLAARVELRLALQNQLRAEQALGEAQKAQDLLQRRLHTRSISHGKEGGRNSVASDDMLSDVTAEIHRLKTMLHQCEQKEITLTRTLADTERQLALAGEEAMVANAQRLEMSALCARNMGQMERKVLDQLHQMGEMASMDREEVLSRIQEVYENERELRKQAVAELQRELVKVREELYRTRHRESNKEMEIAFLQAQLLDAVDRFVVRLHFCQFM